MVGLFAAVTGGDRVVVLGVAHSAAMVVAALALFIVVQARLGRPVPVGAALARAALCAAGAGLVARAVADAVGPGGRLSAAVTVTVGVAAAAAVYVAGQWLLRAPELRRLRSPGPTPA